MEMVDFKGRKGKKRLLALVLAGLMVFSGTGMTPLSVQAETETVQTESIAPEAEETVEAVIASAETESVESTEAVAETETVESTEAVAETETAESTEAATETAESTEAAAETETAESTEASTESSEAAGTEETVVPTEEVPEEAQLLAAAQENAVAVQAAGTYVLDAGELTTEAKAASAKEQAGTNKYFTLLYKADGKSAVNDSAKTFSDNYKSSKRINFQGKATITEAAIQFTTQAAATVTVWWVEGGVDNRQMIILDKDGKQVDVTKETLAKNALCVSELKVSGAGTYYLGGDTNNNYIFKVEVVEASTDPLLEAKDIDVNITLDGKDLLETGDKILLNDTDVTAGGSVKLKSNTTYKITSSNSDIKATVDGKDSVTLTDDTKELVITLESTVVSLIPVMEGEDLGGNQVVAKGNGKEYPLVNGTSVKLPKDTEFTLEVRNAEGNTLETWFAKVNDKNSFSTKDYADGAEVEITISKVSSVKITPEIVGTGLLAENTIAITNAADPTDTHTVVSGTSLELKAKTKYDITVSSSELVAMVGGETSYTTGTEDAAITVEVSTPITKKTEWVFKDSSKGIAEVNKGVAQETGTILTGTDISGSTGILYFDKGTSSGVSYDGQLRFRPGAVLYLPVQDDTTKVTYVQTSNSEKTDRPTYIGSTESGYSVYMPSGSISKTVGDVTDYLVTVEGKKYLPIISGGDVKLNGITLIEYNPVNEVTVSGTVADAAKAGVKSITFKNLDNEKAELVTAEVNADGGYSAVLKRVDGETHYAASVVATGYKINDTDGADQFTLTGNGATAKADFTIKEAPTAKVSGKLSGVSDALIKGQLSARLVPDNAAMSPIELNLTRVTDGEYSFAEVTLEIGREYTVELTNADDLEVLDTIQLSGTTSALEIQATAKPVYAVSGKFVTSDDKNPDVKTITFTNMETEEYSYTTSVTGDSYSINLREGNYLTSVESGSYSAYDHVEVKDQAVNNDVYLQGAVDTSRVAYKDTVKVGEGKEFTKIADAVAYISRMDRTAGQRVTIQLDANKIYREQLVINTPDITIEGNGSTITWYYGVGFSYYSAKLSEDGKSAYYDEAYAVDKYNKQLISQNPGHWGATVNLLSGARGFAAQNLTFENSLNRYLTEEELADGAAENASAAITARNTKNINVLTKAAKERACVLYIQADDTEYKNCKLLSRQDTLYTGDNTENSYFKDCLIEGNVDYICGDGNAVFDGCTLSMLGYAEGDSTGGIIVANKAKADQGYLFSGCKIVYSDNAGVKKTTQNILARAWDAGTVYWINTEVADADIIAAKAYKDMNSKASDAHYYEYNTHTAAGEILDSKRTLTDDEQKTVVTMLTKEEADAVQMTSFFGSWAPEYYDGDLTIEIAEAALKLTAPVKKAAVDNTVSCTAAGVSTSKATWYEGDKAFAGENFAADTEYTAKVTLTAGNRYKFQADLSVTVDGAETKTVVSKDGKTAEVTIVYPKTDEDGYYELKLENGLKAGVAYEGGFSVLQDMDYKAVDGGDLVGGVRYPGYVAGKANPTTAGVNSKGNIPDAGSVLKVVAERDGRLKVAVKINGGKNITVYLVDEATGTAVDQHTNEGSASEKVTLTFNLTAGHTYYVYGNGTKLPLYSVVADYRKPIAWDKIADPVLGTPVTDNKAGTITVPYTAQVGGRNADSIEVRMLQDGKVVSTVSSTAEGDSGEVVFEPAASGSYSFQAALKRTDCEDKMSNATETVNFVLPMRQPVIIGVENLGNGAAKFSWKEVAEADSYKVYLDGVLQTTVTTLSYKFKGLTVGQKYEFGVEAVRGQDADVSSRATTEQTITAEAKKLWNYAAFGSGTDTMSENGKNNGYSGSLEDGTLKLWSLNSKGKLVPASTDGLAYYYTVMDAETENFTLTADITVDSWTFTNGQEGFGLMAADSVGENGDSSVFWNNSYMVSATKVEYLWDDAEGKVSDSGSKYTMKLGVGSQEKIGVTPEAVAADTAVKVLSSKMTTLDTSAPLSGNGAGTYNLVGGYTNSVLKDITDLNAQTTFRMTIQRNNTGYFLSYTNLATGETTTNKYYHGDDCDELTRLDKENIYVGFFASRSARVSVSNVNLVTIDPSKDAPAEERPITYVTPNYTIESSRTANTENYQMVYYGNATGTLTITNSDGAAIVDGHKVEANTKFRVDTTLKKGTNTFAVEFTPDADYQPSKYERLSSYDTVKFNFTVEYTVIDSRNIFVSPSGSNAGAGTRQNPLDIYTAVKKAAPGQKIVLMEGTYLLDKTVVVDRGINGTAEARIYMIADPKAATRPVLDFQEKCAGMILAGDYWYFQGFDVTRSANAQKGIQVSGSHNILDNLKAYKNGNTGVQISRYKSTDSWEDWPSDNLILNCSSYLNADAGYEDADGFAAKLTIADGNVFDGCIAAYNADDGWDLFAKVESGSIGQVIIRNCVAFKNGYILGDNGEEIDAGNGNGFKMGGSSMSGHHRLENSVAFGNKAKGIDSNSCPDIQVYSSTTYNNESFNVAFYTNDAKETAFIAKGILSFKDSQNAAENLVAEQFKTKGAQVESDYLNEMNYYWMGEKSINTEGIEATASWFRNMDMKSAVNGGIYRNADGTINMNGFLELTSAVPEGVGARMTGTASTVIIVDEDSDNNGSDNNGSDNGGSGNNGSGSNGSDNNGSGNSSSSDSGSDNNSSSNDVNWDDVKLSVQNKLVELVQNPKIATVNMNFVCSGEVKVPTSILQAIKGTNVTIAFHSGNGVALSISGQDLKNKDLSKLNAVELTVIDSEGRIPENIVASKQGEKKRLISIKDTGDFGVAVNLHVNVGKENAGKYANLYRYNPEKGRLEYCGSFLITSNGQSMFALRRGGDYLVTVTADKPSESIWYMGGDYTVKAGDTLSAIAKRNHMTLAELLRRNVQITNRNVIKVGQKLNLN